MMRKALRRSGMRAAILLLSLLITAPIAWADDYLHLSHALHDMQDERCPYAGMQPSCEGGAEDLPETSHYCSCLVCIVAIGEADGGALLPPRISGRVVPFLSLRLKPSCFSEIYHPPTA